MANAHGQNVIRNVGEHPIDACHEGQHYTIGPFDRLVLPDTGNTDILGSLASTACSGSTVGGNLYVENEMDVAGDKGNGFAAGTKIYSKQDPSQHVF